jgi:hypothetical protein
LPKHRPVAFLTRCAKQKAERTPLFAVSSKDRVGGLPHVFLLSNPKQALSGDHKRAHDAVVGNFTEKAAASRYLYMDRDVQFFFAEALKLDASLT